MGTQSHERRTLSRLAHHDASLFCPHTHQKPTHNTAKHPLHPHARSTAFSSLPPIVLPLSTNTDWQGNAKQRRREAAKGRRKKKSTAAARTTTTTNQTTTANERPIPPSQHLSTWPRGRPTPSRARRAGAWAILPPPPLPRRRPHHLPPVRPRGPPPRQWELCE